MSAPRPPLTGKVIRVGVVEDGRVTFEKRLGLGESLTVGTGPRAAVRVVDPRLPRLHRLVEHRGGRFHLRPVPGVEGRVVLGGRIRDLAELARAGGSTPLCDRDRGSVQIGSRTLLFQLVDAPPIPPRERAAPAFRGRLLGDDDPVFVGFLALFAVLGGSFSAYAVSVQVPEATFQMAQVRRLARFMTRPPELPSAEPTPGPAEPELPAQPAPAPAPEALVEATPTAPARPLSAEELLAREVRRRQELERSVVEGSLLIKILATGGDGRGRTILPEGAWDGTGPGIDWEELRRRDEVVSVRFGWHEGTGVSREDAAIDLGTVSSGHTEIVGVGSAAVAGVVRPDRIETVKGGPEAERVRAAILGYQGRIKACYERRLKEDPGLGGRLVLTWVVDGGRARAIEILENSTGDEALESCIADSVNHWQFPADILDFAVTYPFVLAPG